MNAYWTNAPWLNGPWYEAKDSVPVPSDLYYLVVAEVERLSALYPLRYCAREKCGEPFRIQDSSRRQANRKPRTGALYCSSACARAQAQADLRKREFSARASARKEAR